jgi:DNA-directed RNA polymerase specialized sigma24 family protein
VTFRLLANRLRRARAAALLRLWSPPTISHPAGDRADVLVALRALPLALHQVVVLHHMFDLPVQMAAHQLGVSSGMHRLHVGNESDRRGIQFRRRRLFEIMVGVSGCHPDGR